jgi:hypothetical protein
VVLGFAQVRLCTACGIRVGLGAFGDVGLQVEARTREHTFPKDVRQVNAVI